MTIVELDPEVEAAKAFRRTQRANQATGLRQLADFIEGLGATDAVPQIYVQASAAFYGGESSLDKAAAAARVMSPCDKKTTNYYFKLEKGFCGDIDFSLSFERDKVCTKRVISTREVTDEVTDTEAIEAAMGSVPKKTTTRTEEEVVWDCPPSLLGNGS